MTRSICLGLVCLVFLVFAPVACGQRVDVWDDPRAEAEYLALEITGELRPPVPLADQIEADLAAIRSAFPQYDDIRVLPDWMPGELLVGMTPSAYSDFKEGTFAGFDPLYATLGIPHTRAHDFGQWLHIQFGQMYHGMRLAEVFQPVSGVRYAEANGIVGDGNDIVARENRTYTLSRGFGDCPAGCIHRESWDFTVTDDGVHLGALVISEPDAGDFNSDGVVDAADYVVWRDGFGSLYDETHLTAWKSNFGAVLGSGSAIAASASVPEPAGAMPWILGALIVCLSCARQRVGS